VGPAPHTRRAAQGTTDYGHYLQNEPSPLLPATIVEKCTQKLVDEWNHLRCQARASHTRAEMRLCNRARARAGAAGSSFGVQS
jgi:hypothetical protein